MIGEMLGRQAINSYERPKPAGSLAVYWMVKKKEGPAYGERGPAKLSRHKAAKPLNLDHAAKPRSHKATCRHSLTGAFQRHKAAKLQKTKNVVEFGCTKSAAKASRNTLACMAGHEPRLWCFSSLWRFETL